MTKPKNRVPRVEDLWYKTVVDQSGNNQKVPSQRHGIGKRRWRVRYVDKEGCERAPAFAEKIDAQRWLDENIGKLLATEIGGTVTVTTTKTGVFVYHDMRKHEDFDETAQALFEIVQLAARKYPGRPRHLYLDIEGHRNPAGGYDADACEILGNFMQEFLGQYLTVFPTVGARLRNPNQSENIPETLDIQTRAPETPEGEAMSVPTLDALLRPVLLAADTPKTRAEIREIVAAAVNLSDEDRKVRTRSGRKTVWDDNTSWTITFLNHSGLLEKKAATGRQYGTQYMVTELGQKILAEHPHIDRDVLRQAGVWRKIQESTRQPSKRVERRESKNSEPVRDESATLEAVLLDALKAIRAVDGFKGGVERARELAHQALVDYESARRPPSSNGKVTWATGGGTVTSGSR